MIAIVNKYWDFFWKEGEKHTILGYELFINKWNKKIICFKKPGYRPYDSKIIMDQVQALLNNVWIEKREGTWGSRIVLAAKLHQEHIQKIDDFIWIMCVSYRKLNGIAKLFEFPILCCNDAIITVSARSNKICIISLDARQGYHQISVFYVDRGKTALFKQDNQKYTFLVMTFSPINAPNFYSSKMKNFEE